ncbi:putative ribonuclease H-like domain-containing protein, partial [Tanacetum coccineum]
DENSNRSRTLGDYSRPSHEGYRNAIELPEGAKVSPLQSDTIWLVQNRCAFHELMSEDPIQHLKDFLRIIDSINLNGATINTARLRLFCFSLCDQAINWLNRLSARSISTWDDLTTHESLCDAWTRFKDLLRKVSHHGLDLWLQVQIFYDHVNCTTQMAIDFAAGKRLRKLKPFLAIGWHLKEIHMTWAHLEKKRTRLRLYTKNHEELCIPSVETASQYSLNVLMLCDDYGIRMASIDDGDDVNDKLSFGAKSNFSLCLCSAEGLYNTGSLWRRAGGTMSNLFLASELSTLFHRVTTSELQGSSSPIQEEQFAEEKERKARTLLLMAVPKDHLRRFHGMDDAKEIWAAIRHGWSGNAKIEENAKKAVLKHIGCPGAVGVSDEKAYHKFFEIRSSTRRQAGKAIEVDGKLHVAFDKRKVNVSIATNLRAVCQGVQVKVPKEGSRQEGSMLKMRKLYHCTNGYHCEYEVSSSVEEIRISVQSSTNSNLYLSEKLNFQANQIFEKDEKLKKYRRIGMKAVKDKDALQKIVDSWFASSKNLWKLIDCGMSSTVKIGLGYGIQSNAEVLGYEEEISRGIFAFRETDAGKYDIPLYSRFKQVEYKGVPHPLSGDYTPREQEDIDDSLYEYGKFGPQPQSPSPTESDASSTVYSTCQSNDSDGELGAVSDHSVNDDPTNDHIPLRFIEQVTSTTPKRLNVKYLHPKDSWDIIRIKNEREIGAGYSFERKPCFVCGSLSHLIKDCDYYEKKMARQAALKSKRVVHADVRQATPAWTNTNRDSTCNSIYRVPNPVITGSINLNTAFEEVTPGNIEVISPSADHEEEVFSSSWCYARIEAIRLFWPLPIYGVHSLSNDVKVIFCMPIDESWSRLTTSGSLQHGYKRCSFLTRLYSLENKKDIMLVQVYVDDIIFGSTNKSWCDEFEALMQSRFQMSSMGELTFFLGLQVKQKKEGIFISQEKYVAEILKKFDLVHVKAAITPMETKLPLTKDEEAFDVDVHLYRSMIGSLMYLTASRPDIMYAVCVCSRFQVTPKTSHLNAVKRIFKYLKGKPNLGLWYPRDSPLDLEAFSDSDYGGSNLDRKSTTGGCQFLGQRLISWQCKKQTIVATSTTEAEYVAAANCCGQVLWVQNQLLDYGFNFMNTKIHIDNESTICIVKNPVYHSKTKHIEIRHHFIRDCYEKKLISVEKIHTDLNVADLLTKPFDGPRFHYLVVSIGLVLLSIKTGSYPRNLQADGEVKKRLGKQVEEEEEKSKRNLRCKGSGFKMFLLKESRDTFVTLKSARVQGAHEDQKVFTLSGCTNLEIKVYTFVALVNTAEVNTAELNAVSTPSAQVNTAEVNTAALNTGETERVQRRKGKDPMTEEDLQAEVQASKKSKELQELADLEEAQRLTSKMDAEKHKDKLS